MCFETLTWLIAAFMLIPEKHQNLSEMKTWNIFLDLKKGTYYFVILKEDFQ